MTSTIVLSRSAPVVLRQAVRSDAAAIAALVERSSTQTRQRRFHGGTAAIPASYLARVCEPCPGDLHLVVAARSRVVALGSLADGELGLLVDDEWQGEGLGRELLRGLLLHAGGPVAAEVGNGNEPVVAWLRRLRPLLDVPHEYGRRFVLDPTATLAALDGRRREAA